MLCGAAGLGEAVTTPWFRKMTNFEAMTTRPRGGPGMGLVHYEYSPLHTCCGLSCIETQVWHRQRGRVVTCLECIARVSWSPYG